MGNNDGTVANITSDQSGGKSRPSSAPRPYHQSTKIKDTGANAQPGQDAPQAPFVNPDKGSIMLNRDWEKASK